MNEVARAWVARQDPRLIRAFRRALRDRCTPVDRALISRWVERTVMRADPSIVRYRRDGRQRLAQDIKSGRGGEVLVFAPDPPEPCWFPTCTHPSGHAHQHNGLTEAGRRLAELEHAIAEGRLVWVEEASA